jgi:phosphoserine phosphatase RsbU/P
VRQRRIAVSEKICIVDDNPVNRRLLTGILQKEGYALIEAADGEEAVDITLRELPDLVLLDIMMPKKDGFQVCEELKRDARSEHIPIIFLSAKAEVADKIKGLELGGSDYVTKPFDRGEVLARVRTHLSISRLTKEILAANEELLQKQRRLNEDLDAAAGIQQSLLPHDDPEMENVAVAWRFMPCESIGGDIFNVIRLDETHWSVYMLDVSGHGVPSALVTVSVSQILHPDRGLILKKSNTPHVHFEIREPAEVLRLLDQEYPLERFNRFFTISYLIIDVKEGLIRYSNAAHPPPILLRSGGTLESLDKGGTIIGMGGVLPFEEGRTQMRPGDKLVVYTDGILEYEDREGQFYGEERFHDVLHQLRDEPIAKVVDGVIDDLMDFGKQNPPRDDVTLLGISFAGE